MCTNQSLASIGWKRLQSFSSNQESMLMGNKLESYNGIAIISLKKITMIEH